LAYIVLFERDTSHSMRGQCCSSPVLSLTSKPLDLALTPRVSRARSEWVSYSRAERDHWLCKTRCEPSSWTWSCEASEWT